MRPPPAPWTAAFACPATACASFGLAFIACIFKQTSSSSTAFQNEWTEEEQGKGVWNKDDDAPDERRESLD